MHCSFKPCAECLLKNLQSEYNQARDSPLFCKCILKYVTVSGKTLGSNRFFLTNTIASGPMPPVVEKQSGANIMFLFQSE